MLMMDEHFRKLGAVHHLAAPWTSVKLSALCRRQFRCAASEHQAAVFVPSTMRSVGRRLE